MTNFTFIQLDFFTILYTLVTALIDGCIIFLFYHFIFKKLKKHKLEKQSFGNEQKWD